MNNLVPVPQGRALAPQQTTAAAVMTLQEKMKYCEVLSAANMLPQAYAGNPGNVLVALELGNALGLEPIVTMMELYVVNNRPSMSAKLMNALIRRAGHSIRIDGDAQQATVTIIRKDDLATPYRSTFSMKQAENAKLTGKDTWKYYGPTMLINRALSACARLACPDLLLGMGYTPEEMGDDGQAEFIALPTSAPAQAEPTQDPGFKKIDAPSPTKKRRKEAESQQPGAADQFPDATEAQATITETPAATETPQASRKAGLWKYMQEVFGPAKAETEGVAWLAEQAAKMGIRPDSNGKPNVDSMTEDAFEELMFALVDFAENQKSGLGG